MTKMYLVKLLVQYKNTSFDYSNESLTLLYDKARTTRNFVIFQGIGDWVFLCESMFPGALHNASNNYYHALAQLSYDRCYQLSQRKISLYQNLADEFTELTAQTKILLKQF